MNGSRPRVRARSGSGRSIDVSIEDLEGRDVVLVRSGGQERRGALGHDDGAEIAAAAARALDQRVPLVLELSSSGADVNEGIDALHGWGSAAAAIVRASGTVPVLAALKGPVLAGPSLLLGLCDAVVMGPQAVAFVSGPSMVAQFTGVEIDLEALGGVDVHSRASGISAIEADDPLIAVSSLLDYLPSHADEVPPFRSTTDPQERLAPELARIVPERDNASYDVREVVAVIADDSDFLELWGRWAPQVVTGLSHIAGYAVGVVANQPRSLAGTLDIAASQKAARFVRFCDAFNLPIITLVDTPGFLPGKDLEWRGMIRHGAELVFAYAEATVPRISVVLRKATGGAYIVMDSKGLGSTLCVAWPSAQPAVMGAKPAVGILHRKATDDERLALEADYERRFLVPWEAAERGYLDMVIEPAETRMILARALNSLSSARERLVARKHAAGPM
ncbi:MAG: acyl-CoA carboxylase subunit beta [Acidimicrobiales bacterium]